MNARALGAAQVLCAICWSVAPRPVAADQWSVEPFGALVGGFNYQVILPVEGENITLPSYIAENTFVTTALSRVGLRGALRWGFSFESVFEANAGFSSYGSSVWEGQAAIQILQQLLRFERWGLRVDVGHVIDESSIDFYAEHIADQLLQDPYTQLMFRASGANRGHGAYATYELVSGLRIGCAFNAANPTSNTGIVVAGGVYNPYPQFYRFIVKETAQSPNHFPADNYHFYLASPSVTFDSSWVQARAAVQIFSINTDTSTDRDDHISGLNLRAGLRGRFFGDRLSPFINVSRVVNNVVDPRAGQKTVPGEDWRGLTFGGGFDANVWGRSGFGAQYALVSGRQGEQGALYQEHYFNFGATVWLNEVTAVGARVAAFLERESGSKQSEGRTIDVVRRDGRVGLFLSVRTYL